MTDWAKYPLEVIQRGHVLNDEEIRLMCAEIERLRGAIGAMQGHTFFCQDADGVLRRWYPPVAAPEFKVGEIIAHKSE